MHDSVVKSKYIFCHGNVAHDVFTHRITHRGCLANCCFVAPSRDQKIEQQATGVESSLIPSLPVPATGVLHLRKSVCVEEIVTIAYFQRSSTRSLRRANIF